MDEAELGIGLLFDQAVGQNARAMDQASDRTELPADLVEKILHGLPVSNVHGVIADLGSRGPDPIEVAPDLALRLHQAESFTENLRCTWAIGMVPDRPPDRGLVAQSGQPAGFSLGCGRSTQEHQPGPERSGKCHRHLGRDPTRSSADHHDVARAERKRGKGVAVARGVDGDQLDAVRAGRGEPDFRGTAPLHLVGDSLRGRLERAESRVQIDGLALHLGPFLSRRLGKARQGTRGRIDRGLQPSQPERSVEP